MEPSSRTPEGEPNRCPICGHEVRIEPSSGFRDAPCPHCGYLLRFPSDASPLARLVSQEFVTRVCDDAVLRAQRGQFWFAVEQLAMCVMYAPDNLHYAQSYLQVLKAMAAQTRGSSTSNREPEAERNVQMAQVEGRWRDSLWQSLQILRQYPSDIPTLRAAAAAVENMVPKSEAELCYLRYALEIDVNDPGTNRHCALAFASRKQYDDAITCWQRVEACNPGDTEARRAIFDLLMNRGVRHSRRKELGA